MFTQYIAMKVTEEQYVTDLKEPLKNLGYRENDMKFLENYSYLCTNWTGHGLLQIANFGVVIENRYLIEPYNPELFLALAAMTEGPEIRYGEYWTSDGKNLVQNNDKTWCFKSGIYYRKATKEELINYFKPIKNTMQTEFTTTREKMQDIYNIACIQWKVKIEDIVKKYGNLFSNEVKIPYDVVKSMFEASTSEQFVVLHFVFPEYSTDNNAFIKTFVACDANDFSKKMFGNQFAFQVSAGTSLFGRPDLKGKSFYVSPELKVIIHEHSCDGSTIIEIQKK